jgi:hypothetical protein
MKTRLFAATFASSVSLLFPSYVLGAGESIGNPINECNTTSGPCSTTPTMFSATIYRLALCGSSPLTSSITPLQWAEAGCQNIFLNNSGETTGDIFSGTGVDLNTSSVTIPPAGTYSKVVALVGKTFKIATHHAVVNAGTSTLTNGTRYVSTSSGGAIAGTAGSESLYDVTINTFAPQLACSGQSTPNYKNDTGVAGNNFNGALLNSSEVMTTTGSGNIANSTAVCDNVAYIVTIIDKPITVTSTALGINLKIRATTGAATVIQDNSGNGVVTGFSGTGASFTFDVSTF